MVYRPWCVNARSDILSRNPVDTAFSVQAQPVQVNSRESLSFSMSHPNSCVTNLNNSVRSSSEIRCHSKFGPARVYGPPNTFH